MTAPTVTVVIPARNAAPFIGEQLESLAAQVGAPDFDVVLADNGSSDGTAERARRVAEDLDLDLIVVDARGIPSASHGRNVGAEQARGRILAFCDADDLVNETWVADLAAGVDSQDRVLVAGAVHHERFNTPEVLAAYRIGPDPTPEEFARLPRLTVPDRGFAGYLFTVPGGNFAIRRDDYLRLGGMDPSYPGGAEETDFAWRAQEGGMTVLLAPRAVVHYRLKADPRSLFRQQRIQQRGRIYLWTRFRNKGMSGPSIKASIWALASNSLSWASARSEPAERLARSYQAGAHLGALEGMVRYRLPRGHR
ncbi:glycosyltransferase family 2 protein [Micrococcus luteus]|nr:glycosyltransferase family 2 protein [Micrococcus luteus]